MVLQVSLDVSSQNSIYLVYLSETKHQIITTVSIFLTSKHYALSYAVLNTSVFNKLYNKFRKQVNYI